MNEPQDAIDDLLKRMETQSAPEPVPQSLSEPAQESDGVDAVLKRMGGTSPAAPAAESQAGPPEELAARELGPIGAGLAYFLERVFQSPPGQLPAAKRLASGTRQEIDFALPGLLTTGREPVFADFEALAKKDPNFAATWKRMNEFRVASEDMARTRYGVSGDKVDWNAVKGEYVRARAEQANAEGWLPPSPDMLPKVKDPVWDMLGPEARASVTEKMTGEIETLLRGPTPGRATIVFKADPLGAALTQFAQEAENGPPGITRPPVSKEELAQEAWNALRGVQAEQMKGQLHPLVQEVLGGAGDAVPTVASFAVPGGPGLARGVLQGAAISTGSQVLGMAGGGQETFDFGALIRDTAIFGGAYKAAQKIGGAIGAGESAKGVMTLAGQTAFNEASRLYEQGGLSEEAKQAPFKSGLGWLIHNASMLLTAHALGSTRRIGEGKAGQQKPEHARPIRTDAEIRETMTRSKAKADAEKVQATADALYDTLSAVMARFGVRRSKTATANETKLVEEFFPLGQELEGTYSELNKFLNEKSGGDGKKRREIANLLWLSVEGKSEFSPSPALKNLLSEADLSEGIAKQQAFAEVGLRVGQKMWEANLLPEARVRPKGATEDTPDTIIFKRDFDEGRYSREDVAQGKDGELVGSYAFHETRGDFQPHFTREKTTTEKVVGFGKRLINKAPLKSKDVQEHLKRRELSAAEKLEKGIPLDTEPARAFDLFQEQLESAMGKRRLDMIHEQGLIRQQNALPTTEEKRAVQIQIKEMDAELKELRAAYKKAAPAQRAAISQEMSGITRLKEELSTFADDTGFVKLRGAEWGEYEGWYMHRGAKQQSKRLSPDRSGAEALFSTIGSFIKSNEVGMNPALFFVDKVSNMKQVSDAGIPLPDYLKAQPLAMKLTASRRLGKGNFTHKYGNEFFALEKGSAFGGPTDIAEADTASARRLKSEKKRAFDQDRSTVGFTMAQGVEKVQEALHTIPGMKQLSRAKRALGDEADALASYIALREKGMTPTGAIEYVRGIFDYKTLPDVVQKAALGASYLRYRAKVLQSMATRAWLRKPSIFGLKLPTPFDAVINRNPGSPAAQAALVGRGLLRMGLSSAQWITPFWGAQQALLASTGISKQELDEDLDARYSNLPSPARWLIKSVALPTGKSPAGRIEYIDASQAFPEMSVLRYFWLQPKATDNFWVSLMNKNIFAPFVQGALNEDYRGRRPAQGWHPGERWWPSISALTPAFISQPIAAYAREMKEPPGEGDPARAIIRSVLGVPVSVADLPNPMRHQIDDWIGKGIVGIEERDDGSWNLYVRPQDNPEDFAQAMAAQQVLTAISKTPMSPYGAIRKAHDRIQRQLAPAGNR